MEHLTKQQIVLLTLFVTFVTSIATGIVTVSLMNQAPAGVTQTLNQVIEKTVERVVPNQNTATISQMIQTQDQLSNAIDKIRKSMVKIKPITGNGIGEGFGLIVSKEGVIIADKSIIPPPGNVRVIFSDGQEFDAQLVQVQTNGDIAFLYVDIPDSKRSSIPLVPIKFASSIKLGQSISVLYGKNMDAVVQGIIEKIEGNVSDTVQQVNLIKTSTSNQKTAIGSPLFNLSGEIIGLKTTSFALEDSNAFYPLGLIKSAIPSFKK